MSFEFRSSYKIPDNLFTLSRLPNMKIRIDLLLLFRKFVKLMIQIIIL